MGGPRSQICRRRRITGVLCLAAAGLLLAASPASAFGPLGQRGVTGNGGPAAGNVGDPYQAAIDSSGNLLVTDPDNWRIDEFAPDGSFIKAFGKDVGGAGVNVCTTICQAGADDSSAASFSFP